MAATIEAGCEFGKGRDTALLADRAAAVRNTKKETGKKEEDKTSRGGVGPFEIGKFVLHFFSPRLRDGDSTLADKSIFIGRRVLPQLSIMLICELGLIENYTVSRDFSNEKHHIFCVGGRAAGDIGGPKQSAHDRADATAHRPRHNPKRKHNLR